MTPEARKISSEDFGKSFIWGVAMAAAQNEGAYDAAGRGPSIWDQFAARKSKIHKGATPNVSCDFYHRYKDDILLAKALGFNTFRFSISWSRVIPQGIGRINKEGIAFYHRLIDECLANGLEPMVTLYHWDLPYALQKEGGWTSIFLLKWFSNYVNICTREFGDKVKYWIVLNEPMGFTSLGYMLGKHAPGLQGLSNFLPAVHNAALAQGAGGRIIRDNVRNACIGTTFSCSEVVPATDGQRDKDAAKRVDILLNRLFVEPALGMGFPDGEFPLLEKLHFHSKSWRNKSKYKFDFDFIGLQNYFPVTVKFNAIIPYVQASEIQGRKRKVPVTDLGWEINPRSFANIIQSFASYPDVRKIIISENGASFRDIFRDGQVNDEGRTDYFKKHLRALYDVKRQNAKLIGYLAWTLTDNFEWAEGYRSRFGLVHVDFKTQLRTVKSSGYWWRDFLNNATYL